MSWGRVYEIALGAGGVLTTPGGRFFKLITAANDVDVEFFSDGGEPLAKFEGVKAGLKVDIQKFYQGADPLVGFGKVQITSAAAQTVACIVSRQPIDYDNVAVTVDVNAASANPTTGDVSLLAAATTLIKAAGTRKAILITNLSANAQIIRIGDSNAGVARGIELSPGMTAELATSGAVYGYNPGAAAQSVGILELT